MNKFFAAVPLALCLWSTLLFSQQYGYHEGTAFYLGNGFDPLNISQAFARCIEHNGELRLDGNGARSSSVSFKTVKSQQQLFRELGVSAELSANFFFGGGKTKTSYLDQIEFFDDSLTWIIVGHVDYGRIGMVNPHLTEASSQLIQSGHFAEFARLCGTHYFAQEDRGARIVALYTLHNVSQSQKTIIESLLQVQANLGFASAQLDMDVKNMMTKALKSSQMEFQLFSVGGSGLVELSDVIVDATNVSHVQTVVRNYVKTMTAERAAPTGYLASSMSSFGWGTNDSPSIAKREQVLTEYYFLINEATTTRKRLNKILLDRYTRYKFLSSQDLDSYKSLRDELTEKLENLNTAAKICFKDAEKCEYPNIEWPPIQWPDESSDRCESLRLRAFDVKAISAERLNDMRRADLVPLLCPDDNEICATERCAAIKMRISDYNP